MVDGSGSNPKDPEQGLPSALPWPDEKNSRPRPERKLNILLAEDNRADIFLIREALAHHGIDSDLKVHRDGEEMLRTIEQVESGKLPHPDLILLDLNLPKQTGLQLLSRLRESPVCANVSVIIVTSSDAPSDHDAVARLGADSYFRKPSDYDQFLQLGGVAKDVIARKKQPLQ